MTRSRITQLLLAVIGLFVGWAMTHHFGLLSLGTGALLPLAFGTVQSDSDVGRQLAAWGFMDVQGGLLLRAPIPKTGNYTVVAPSASGTGDPSGTEFTNAGAGGAVTFTLFAPAPAYKGVFYEFHSQVDQNMVVNCGGANGVAVNNATVTTVTCSTASQKIGAHVRAVCDGAKWLLHCDQVGITYTLA